MHSLSAWKWFIFLVSPTVFISTLKLRWCQCCSTARNKWLSWICSIDDPRAYCTTDAGWIFGKLARFTDHCHLRSTCSVWRIKNYCKHSEKSSNCHVKAVDYSLKEFSKWENWHNLTHLSRGELANYFRFSEMKLSSWLEAPSIRGESCAVVSV